MSERQTSTHDSHHNARRDIAIIGMSCRFPGANDARRFWSDLATGVCRVGPIPPDRWPSDRTNCPQGGFLDRVEDFDARFFQISPREAANMDPQQRLLLQEAWRCVEDSGVALTELRRKVASVFVGAMTIDHHQIVTAPGVEPDSYACLGNYICILANRISHLLQLKGLSLALDTACSSSLVALHLARESLARGESDYALAAGVNLNLRPWKWISFSKSRMLSPAGLCKTFDQNADGYAPGEGVAVVLLQRLDEAIRDGNRILGVIKGSAINHCGGAPSITAPSVESQRELILAALRDARAGSETIGYVEAHGTGTSLGDPIEAEALAQAFAAGATPGAQRLAPCKLGSVKSNIGHLEAAAGLAGVIKTLLMFRHRRIPPTLHVQRPNPLIDFARGPLELATTSTPWNPASASLPLRAGVSSFGFGGVNAHVVLESPPERLTANSVQDCDDASPAPFLLSAKTPASLARSLDHWASAIEENALPLDDWRSVCETLMTGRESFPCRVGTLVRSREEIERFIAQERQRAKTRVPMQADAAENARTGVPIALRIGRMEEADWSGLERLRRSLGHISVAACDSEADAAKASTIASEQGIPQTTVLYLGATGELAGFGPFRIDADYTRHLREGFAFDSDLTRRLAEDALSLWESQPTFRKFLDEWASVARSAGLGELKALIQSPAEAQQKLTQRILIAAFRQINAKWSLSTQRGSADNALELADLLIDGILSHRDFLDLIASEDDETLHRLARTMSDRSDRIDRRKPYAELRRHSRNHDDRLTSRMAERAWTILSASPLRLEFGVCPALPAPGYVARGEDPPLRVLLDLWLHGATVDWGDWVRPSHPKAELPGYAFNGERFWLPDSYSESKRPESRALPDAIRRTIQADEPIIRGHVIGGRPLIPAALMIVTALNICEERKESALALADLAFRRPGFADKDLELTLNFNVDDASAFEFSIGSGMIATGRIAALESARKGGNREEWSDPAVWATHRIEGAAIYQDLQARGYDYGADYQVIRQAWQGEDRTAFLLERRTADREPGAFDPYLLDGALQAAAWLRGGAELAVPSRIARLELKSLRERCWVVIRTTTVARGERESVCDVDAFHERGDWIGGIERLSLRVPHSASVAETSASVTQSSAYPNPKPNPGATANANAEFQAKAMIMASASEVLLHRPVWVLAPRSQALSPSSSESWGDGSLVLDHNDPLGDAVFARLGPSASRIRLGLDRDAGDRLAAELESRPPSSRIFLILPPRQRDGEAGLTDHLLTVLTLTRVLAQQKNARSPSLTIATRDAQIVRPQDFGAGYGQGGLEGLAKTLELEFPRVGIRLLDFDAATTRSQPAATATFIVDSTRDGLDEILTAYREGQRYVRVWEPAPRLLPSPSSARSGSTWREGGVYLIAGGAGGIGDRIARAIAGRVRARIVTAGRSSLDSSRREALEELRRLGGGADYVQADLIERSEAERLVRWTQERHGPIRGVIHLCGILEDGLAIHKTADSFRRVFDAKVRTALHLDHATRGEPLDFFAAFSSIVAVYGNIGQADYAAANGWLDGYLSHRARVQAPGRSVSINWPLWIDGGMGTDEPVRRGFQQRGLDPLASGQGAAAFLDLMERDLGPQILVAARELPTPGASRSSRTESRPEPKPQSRREDQENALGRDLTRLIASKAGLDPKTIPWDEPFFAMGVESLMLDEIMSELGRRFDGLSPTLLFDFPNIRELAGHLASREPKASEFPMDGPRVSLVIEAEPQGEFARDDREFGYGIAIIGMDGRFPEAPDADVFWENLRAGRDCVREAPADRWGISEYYDPSRKRNRSYGKWGGFLDGVDEFDPTFFNISPREAEQMDPQQRLFLESVWKTLEHAGYGSRRSRQGRRVGLFVGTMWNEYTIHSYEQGVASDDYAGPGSLYWAIANRVSYTMDLRGPSMAIDTACSSSLTALHLACQAILAGDCEMAVAGGVNLSLHPFKYAYLSQAKFLSTDGKCRSFGEGGDGYVPGEGVGAVLLKPLAQAIADRDQILAVVRGTSVNHGGKAAGFTVPNSAAQADLIREAMTRARVSADRIGYVECHGTGTALGDPIEINALTEAWGGGDRDGGCVIGSVKSNIGHLEAAAGIAGLIKVMLCMRHGAIPPSLHSEVTNRRIDFASSPFRIADRLLDWSPDADGSRVAAISSFGAGGSNAHAILELPSDLQAPSTAGVDDERPRETAILLSAKTSERLVASAQRLRGYLDRPSATLNEIAYALQTGREPLTERLALVCRTIDELRARLDDFLDRGKTATGVYRSKAKADATADDVDALLYNRRIRELAQRWVEGVEIDWSPLAPPGSVRKVPLPVYPFARERYWVPQISSRTLTQTQASDALKAPETQSWLLEPTWVEIADEPTATPPPPPSGTVLLLLSRENEKAIRASLAGLGQWSGVTFLTVRRGDRSERISTSDVAWELNFSSLEEGRRIAEEILRVHPRLDGVIDFSDFSDRDRIEIEVETGRLALLQTIVGARYPEPMLLLHVARSSKPCLTPRPGLAGAWVAGLYATLAAEYRNIIARSLDLDIGPSEAAQVFGLLLREWSANDPYGEICVRAGRRHRPSWAPFSTIEEGNARTSAFQADPDKTYVITGGTRGIGAEIARWLVERGATRLALLGLQPVPPRERWAELAAADAYHSDRAKIELALDLERRGARVVIASGSLLDSAWLRGLFAEIETSMGPIGGVAHCAGLAPSKPAAFLKRDLSEARRVLEPKVEGLITLFETVPWDRLDFFTLFSSVSASAPALGAGIGDYASANRFMDAFAACHQARGFAALRSINWPNWSEAGVGEFRGGRSQELGLEPLATADALRLFERILLMPPGAPHRLLPCVVAPERFQPDALTRIDHGRSAVAVTLTPVAPPPPSQTAPATAPASRSEAQDWLTGLFSSELKLSRERIDSATDFADFGVDSVMWGEIVQKIETRVDAAIDPSVLLEHQSIDRLASHLASTYPSTFESPTSSAPVASAPELEPIPAPAPMISRAPAPQDSAGSIAVIGLGCQFPGSEGADAYWANLIQGVCGIVEVPRGRWDIDRLFSADASREPGRSISRWGGFLKNIEDFDPDHFGISGVDPVHIDPLERQFLEACSRAMRDAGYTPEEWAHREVGVFAGSRVGNYARKIARWSKNSIVGVGQNFIAAHAAQLFNFTGPNLVVDTACSSSLTSLHLACQSLRLGECEIALAGGVDILLDEQPYLLLTEAKALSPDGRCRVFDSKANGFVPGEGAGVAVLKPLAQAIADGDRIYAVINGSAFNNDGRTMGITTPSLKGQQIVIERALRQAGVDPDQIGLVEAHGTGTMIGDPIELKGLTTVYRRSTSRVQYCGIGSVKSNIGHTLSAAGIAGFIKIALALHHRTLPPTLFCDEPNRRFDFESSPFFPILRAQPWDFRGPRRAGISSFGFGGANVHLIASEFDPDRHQPGYVQRRTPSAPPQFRKRRFWPDDARTSDLDVAPIMAPIRVSVSTSASALAPELVAAANGRRPMLAFHRA